MNLAQKIGQLLVVGFDGVEVNDHIRNVITNYHAGNIILFERNCQNPEQIFKLVQDLQKIAMESNGVPLFITIDQENGVVTRIYDGVAVFPGSMAQTAGASIDEIKQIAQYTGEGLDALGINFNLAPSVDINNNARNPVIGVRSFGETGEQVAERANAYIEGLQQSGVIATAKHFPGHGDTSVDSHLDMPSVGHDKERLEAVELYPFKSAIAKGVKAIMSAHVKFPAYEPNDLPGTLSYEVLTNLLRKQLGFDGVVITDCMEMKAIDTYYGTSKATPLSIAAGADLVCLSHSEAKQIDAVAQIYKAIEEGKITIERIDESVARILKLKAEYDVTSFLAQGYEDAKAKLYQKAHFDLAERISLQSITLLKNNGLLPVKATDLLVIAPSARVLTGADGTKIAPNFAKAFKEQVTSCQVDAYEIAATPTDEEIVEVIKRAKGKELVILCTHNGILVPKQMELASKVLEVNQKVILIPMRNPYDIEVLPTVECCILPYEYTSRSIDSLIKVLMGEVEPVGKLPITLNI